MEESDCTDALLPMRIIDGQHGNISTHGTRAMTFQPANDSTDNRPGIIGAGWHIVDIIGVAVVCLDMSERNDAGGYEEAEVWPLMQKVPVSEYVVGLA